MPSSRTKAIIQLSKQLLNGLSVEYMFNNGFVRFVISNYLTSLVHPLLGTISA